MLRVRWLAPIRRHIRLQNAMVVLCAVLVGAYGTSTYSSLRRAHDQTIADAVGSLEGIARSAEVDTNRSIFEIDAMLLGIERLLDVMMPDTPMQDPAVRALINEIDDQTLSVRDILILDGNGQLVNKSVATGVADRDFSDAAFFTAHQGEGQPSLYIGPPQRSRATGGWSMMLSRPLMHRDKLFGVIAAEVPITTFTDFYSAVVANSGVRVRLLRGDGTLVASEPHQEEAEGRPADNAGAILAAAVKRRAGILEDAATANDERVVAFARVPGRPLLVAVSRQRPDILRQWQSDATSSVVAFVLFAVTAMCLTWLMVRALDRQQLAAAEVAAGEDRLKRQSELLQSTLEYMGEGLSVFDGQGRLVAWNARFVELLDLPADLSPKTSLRDVLWLQTARGDFGPPELAPSVDERYERFLREVPSVRERVTTSGRTLQIRRRAMPGGGVVSLYSDITERKAAEARMAQAWAQAELANRAKSDFLANMSHELRTPLNAIIGFSEIISAEHLGPLKNVRYLEYAHDIHASGLHLLTIINDVLDMSKIEAGKLDIHEEEVAVAPLLSSTMRMVRERARSQQVELLLEPPADDHIVCVDERAMKQCLLNLLSNAVKFSTGGGLVSVAAAIDPQGRTVLSVADKGIGMSDPERERALQPFGQAHSATTRTYGGTGLGLSITKGLVEAHGGTLTIESQPGVGTSVSVILPAHRTCRATPHAGAELAVLMPSPPASAAEPAAAGGGTV